MSLVVYNTLTRRKEPLHTLEPGRVRLYVCGPTVYDRAHVGHAMSALVFDVVRRYLEFRGYRVTHVMNFTDVDDKIIERARALGRDSFQLAEGYIDEFHEHLRALGVKPASAYPRATETMERIIAMVGGLIERGLAYAAGGDVYFRVQRAPGYGKLSGRRLEEMQAGARVEVGEHKEHPMDFALWKAAKPGEPAWDSPWGPGRPGWHIECSAMNVHYLGEQIDIHGGGNDLIFPHHENEIAQSESFTGKPLARLWMHNGMLQLAGEKMSKSLGNLVAIETFLQEHEADALRMLVLNSSYRSPLTFSDESVLQAERALARLRAAATARAEAVSPVPQAAADALRAQTQASRQGLVAAMDDDFNTAGALAHLFELARAINTARDAGVAAPTLQEAQDGLRSLADVLGLRLEAELAQARSADKFVDLLIKLRDELRQAKQYALADSIRDRLQEMGVVLEDSKQGTQWSYQRVLDSDQDN